ncbi:hypothetical protein ZPR_3961 [Zunongwangia profunda SM-A87]|uniref:Uncharacterized protein n=1 Tax=Zunongwangia profunda (strain DSM 18752 / CCTCC AB 206139 / SM-A87) TaxID=655815 RepID=D5B9F2_ZUNPS|nr:hypothetical protein ZPR_3961 [Zunongwangia profunda SM-A87]
MKHISFKNHQIPQPYNLSKSNKTQKTIIVFYKYFKTNQNWERGFLVSFIRK